MVIRKIVLVFCICVFTKLNSQPPHVWLFNAEKLETVKKKKDAGEHIAYLDKLASDANQLLNMKLVSVMDKGFTPPSGSKHDYMSQAPYFWYDSSKPNGLPYMRRDGERNPEINKITDRKNIGELSEATQKLALAWYFTGNKQYATKAAQLLHHWFLAPETKMNPNLDFGQGIPGINTGRGIGIIETSALMGIADAAGLIENSGAWPAADQAALKEWYKQYLQWMLTSKNGGEEHAAKNNHGTWYYAQVTDFALFTGDMQQAAKLANEAKKIMDGQITPEGKQPLELERTNALGYSTYNLQAWFRLATLASRAGVDLWNYHNASGVGIRNALDWLTPFALGKQHFEYQQIDKYNPDNFNELRRQAWHQYKSDAYKPAGEEGSTSDSFAIFYY